MIQQEAPIIWLLTDSFCRSQPDWRSIIAGEVRSPACCSFNVLLFYLKCKFKVYILFL